MNGRGRRAVGAAAIVLALAFLFWLTAAITSELPQTFVVGVNVQGPNLNPGDSTTQRPAPLSLSVLADAKQDAGTPSPSPIATPTVKGTTNPSAASTASTARPTPSPAPWPTASPAPKPTPTPILTNSSATIAGQVLDSQTRNPIVGATVSASPGLYTTITGTNGNFSLAVAPGTYSVTASDPTYSSSSTTVSVNAGQTQSIVFKLTSSVTYGSIAGTVLDSVTRTPVVGATVSLSNGLVRITDTNGNFSYSLVLTGSYTMTVSAVGYVTQTLSVSVKAGKTTNVQIALVAG